jgi:hypothetical protein
MRRRLPPTRMPITPCSKPGITALMPEARTGCPSRLSSGRACLSNRRPQDRESHTVSGSSQ